MIGERSSNGPLAVVAHVLLDHKDFLHTDVDGNVGCLWPSDSYLVVDLLLNPQIFAAT
jgi:hypothetical protein